MASLAILASLGSLHIDAFGHGGIASRGIWPTIAHAHALLIQTPLDRRARAAPRSGPTQQTVYVVAPTMQLLTISLAKPFLSNTTSNTT